MFTNLTIRFKAKHEKDWANIIDLTQEKKEELLLDKTVDDRRDELVMLEEFRRRKNLENFREKVYSAEKDEEFEDINEMPRYEHDPYAKIRQTSGGPNRFFKPSAGEIYNPADFTLLFMETDSVTLVTKLNRINHRRILVFIGNGNGVISYAKGKGVDYQSAFQNAYIKLKKNMIVVDLDPLLTNGSPLYARHNDFRLWIYPRANPNYWGSIQIMHMLIYTGMYHCRFVVKSRENDRYAMIYAFFAAVTQAKKPSFMAEISGQKFAAISYHSPMGRSLMPMEVNYYERTQGPS